MSSPKAPPPPVIPPMPAINFPKPAPIVVAAPLPAPPRPPPPPAPKGESATLIGSRIRSNAATRPPASSSGRPSTILTSASGASKTNAARRRLMGSEAGPDNLLGGV